MKKNIHVKSLKKKFFEGNRINYIVAASSQILIAIFYSLIAFLIMVTIEAMESTDLDKIFDQGKLLLIILIGFLISSQVNRIFKNRFIMVGLSNFKAFVFDKILDKDIGEFEEASSGGIISAFYNDLGSIEINYLGGSFKIIHGISLVIISVFSMFYINTFLAVCVLVACSIPFVISISLGKKLVTKEKNTSIQSESFAEQVKDLLNGFIVIKSFKAEKEVLDLFNNQNFTLEEAKQERRDTNDTIVIAGQISSVIMISVIFVVGQFLVYQGAITIGIVIAFIQLANNVFEPIQILVPLRSNRKAAISLLEKISKVVMVNSDATAYRNRTESIDSLDGKVVLEDVSFSFSSGKNVLDNINVEFESGKSYAVIGNSGCGKSTLLQLLLGYYNNYNGRILYGDKELSNISYESLYDYVSIIQQNVFMFDSSIRNNVTMFKDFNDEEIKKVIDISGLSNLIDEKGLDYKCGVGGCNLSGGEKQRISIARALLKATPIIFMDEATAALDNIMAFEIEEDILNIDGIMKVIVTHRLEASLLKKYNEIITLKNGKVVEKGSFDDLMEKKGHFYSMYSVSA